MTDLKQRPTMQLWWHLYVDCPKCGTTTDAAKHDQENSVADRLFSNQWDKLEGHELTCPMKKEIIVGASAAVLVLIIILVF